MSSHAIQLTTFPRPWRLVALLFVFVAAGALWAALPSKNPKGATLLGASADIWSGADRTNKAGRSVSLAATLSASRDSTNLRGATVYVGHLDPTDSLATRANPVWLSVE